MGKYLITILFFLLTLGAYAQYPGIQSIGTDSSLVTAKGGLKGRIVNTPFTDTTQANTQRIKFYNGAQIVTYTGGAKFWIRDSALTKWIQLSSGGGGDAYLDTTYRRADTVFGVKDGVELIQWTLASDSAESYQWSVIDSLSVPPSSPAEGDKYLVGTAPTGVWTGFANQIATYDSTGNYTFETATTGDLLYNATLAVVDKFNGTTWDRLITPTNVNWWTRLNENNVSGQFARIGPFTYSSIQQNSTSYGFRNFWRTPNGTSGSVAIGPYSQHHNWASGYNNTSVGDRAMWYGVTGHDNVAIGKNAMGASGNINYGISLGTASVGEERTLVISDSTRKMRMKLDSAVGTPYSIVGVDALGNWRRYATPSSGSSYTFSNGLTEAAGAVKLGGALTENTTIGTGLWNLNTDVAESEFKATVGSNIARVYLNPSSPYARISLNSATTVGYAMVSSGSLWMHFKDNSVNRQSNIFLERDSITFQPSLGYIHIDTLAEVSTDTTANKPIVWNTATKRMQRMGWPSSGGGGNLINGAANIGTGAEVFKDTSSNKINLRKINAETGTGAIVTQNTNDIAIAVDTNAIATKARVKHVADSLGYIISGESVAWGTYAQRVALTGMVAGQKFYQTDERVGQWIYSGSEWQHYPTKTFYRWLGGANTVTGSVSGAGSSAGRSNGVPHFKYGIYLQSGTGTTSTGYGVAYSVVTSYDIPTDTSFAGPRLIYYAKAALTRAPTNGDDFRAVIGMKSIGSSSLNDSSASGYGNYFRISWYRDSLYIQCHSQSRTGPSFQTTTTTVPYSGMVLSNVYSGDPYFQGDGYDFAIHYGAKYAEFYINGVLVASHNLGSVNLANWLLENGPVTSIQKVSGTTNSRLFIFDQYIYRK